MNSGDARVRPEWRRSYGPVKDREIREEAEGDEATALAEALREANYLWAGNAIGMW